LEGEIQAEGHSHVIQASIGAVLIPDGGANADEIIHHADLAMYRAKGQDQSSVVFFEPTTTHRQQVIN
jgi:GGDEF domain-containing protein